MILRHMSSSRPAGRLAAGLTGLALALSTALAGSLTLPAAADVTTPLAGPSFQSTGTEMVTFGGHLYFAANDGEHGNELWRTDGTAAGTTLVADLNTQGIHSNPYRLTVAGDRLFFNVTGGLESPGGGSSMLWVYDGSGAPQLVSTPVNDSVGYIMGTVGSTLLATGYINHHIVNGKHVVRSVTAGSTDAVLLGGGGVTADSTGSLSSFGTELGGWLYFNGSNTSGAGEGAGLGWSLYRTNGSTIQLVSSAASSPSVLTTVGGLVFFSAIDPTHGRELWRTDGTAAGTFRVFEHVPGSGAPAFHELVAHQGRLYYSVQEPAYGAELWTSDGTTAGTRIVKDIAPGTPGSGPAQLTSAGSGLYFRTNAGIWVTDGTDSGTAQLATPTADGYGVQLLTALGTRLYFRAGDTFGTTVVWRTDGTPATTFPVSAGAYDADPTAGNAAVGAMGVLGNKVVFTSRFPGDPLRTAWVRLNVIDTAASDPVRSATVSPSISGTAKPDSRLDITDGTWTMSPQRYTFQWYRNGAPVQSGGTQGYLWLRASDLGATIHATVTASGLGAPPTTVATASVVVTKTGAVTTPPAAKKLRVKKKPRIKGKAKVGKTLKAKAPVFAQNRVKVKYQWFASGKKIKKATKKKLKVTRALKGKRIVVKVTATKAGFARTTVKSKATKKVVGR